jgi:protein Tex
VTNLTAFGAFVDVGVHQDGLVHLSQLADRFVKDPGEVLKVRQAVLVTVLAVDLERKRISLSLKTHPDLTGSSSGSRPTEAAERLAGEGGSVGAGKPGAGRGEGGNPRPGGPPRGRREDGGAKRGQNRDEAVPFNNPFAAVFGKK